MKQNENQRMQQMRQQQQQQQQEQKRQWNAQRQNNGSERRQQLNQPISSKEKIPFSKEDHRILDREMATAEVMDGMIKEICIIINEGPRTEAFFISDMVKPGYLRYFPKNSRVRCQASFAAASL
jgi:hypothetical protein